MKKLGIITAMNKEMLPIYGQLGEVVGSDEFFGGAVYHYADGDTAYYVATSGIGEIYAAATTELLIERYGVDAILNFGLVGSLSPEYSTGDLLICARVVHHQFDLTGIGARAKAIYDNRIDPYWELSPSLIERVQTALPESLRTVTIASGDEFIADAKKKNRLVKDFKADICDMESAGIAVIAAANHTPVLMIKMVSDNADDKSADDYNACVGRGIYKYRELVKLIADAI